MDVSDRCFDMLTVAGYIDSDLKEIGSIVARVRDTLDSSGTAFAKSVSLSAVRPVGAVRLEFRPSARVAGFSILCRPGKPEISLVFQFGLCVVVP
jgi:hypothetical protein